MKRILIISVVLSGVFAGLTAQTVMLHRTPKELISLEQDSVTAFNLFLSRNGEAAFPVVERIAANQPQVTFAMQVHKMPSSSTYVFEALVYQLRILARDRKDSLMAARVVNQLTTMALDTQGCYPGSLPLDLPRLSYLGRELVILANQVQNFGLMRQRVLEFQQVWTRVRPSVDQHGGDKLSAQMNEVINDLKIRVTPEQVIRNANRIFAIETAMEKLY